MDNKKYIALIALALALGLVTGRTTAGNSRFAAGELSACSRIMTQLNRVMPLGFACEIYKGQVTVTSPMAPGKHATLEGAELE